MSTISQISSLPSEIIARILIRRLWRLYDAGGVSLGRSLRSHLLESFLYLLPELRLETDTDEFKVWDLIDELEVRMRLEKKRLKADPLLFFQLEYLPTEVFSCLVLQAMAEWYEKNSRSRDPLIFERRILLAIHFGMSVSSQMELFSREGISYSVEHLIEEGRERRHRAHQIQMREMNPTWDPA